MTSDPPRNALSRYAEAHKRLTDLDAERDCLAVLVRRARARLVHAEATDQRRLKLEHGALQRAVDLFMDEYDRPTRSSLKATIQAALAELGADGPSAREKARHLNGLREPLFSPPTPTHAEIRASLQEIINPSEARRETLQGVSAAATAEPEATPDKQSRSAHSPDALDPSAGPDGLMAADDPSQSSNEWTQLLQSQGIARSLPMRLVQPHIIEFDQTSTPGTARAYLALGEDNGFKYVGIAWPGYGQSPTNRFAELARFIWQVRHYTWSFHRIKWFDLQRSYDSDTSLVIVPVALRGYALRRSWRSLWRPVKVDGAPEEGDRYVVEDKPEWGRAVTLDSLPYGFQAAIRHNVMEPLGMPIWPEPEPAPISA